MPYVVSSPAVCQAFPRNCAYCGGASPTSTTVAQPYSKKSLSMIPGGVKTNTWTFDLPACKDCAGWFRSARITLYLLGASAVLLPAALTIYPDTPMLPAVWCGIAAGYVGMLLWRRYRSRAFRIAYVGDNEIVYAAREENFAREFARENNLAYEHRLIVMRIS